MPEALASESTETSLPKPRGDLHPGGRSFALIREWRRGETDAPSLDAPGQRNTRTLPHFGNNHVAIAVNLFYRAKEWIGRLGPTESPLGLQRLRAAQDLVRQAVRIRLACVSLALLVLVAVMVSPIQRSSSTHSRRFPEGFRRNFSLPASDSSRLSVTALILREDAVVTGQSENDEEDDDETCAATRLAYETYDSPLSSSRTAPARNLAVPRHLSARRRLRC